MRGATYHQAHMLTTQVVNEVKTVQDTVSQVIMDITPNVENKENIARITQI